jgi:hypothetical protein
MITSRSGKASAAIIAFAFAVGMLSAPATAMNVGLSSPIVASDVVLVAGGCGLGMHRGPYGGCRRNFANPAAHACPRGFHIGPGGRCRGNGR